MEEDFKILEKFLKGIQFNELEELMKSDEVIKFIDYKELKALENLLTRYKELKRKNNRFKRLTIYDVESKYLEGKRNRDNYWKSKIQKKIEELENCIKLATEENWHAERTKGAITVLQELLGRSREDE